MSHFRYESHDDHPAEASAVVDAGLGDFNDRAAPLHEVQRLACFVRDDAGRVVGGAVGRRWGTLCELQQLWVDPAHRGHGLGTGLMAAFEHHALQRGCRSFYLETLSFQAPHFYEKLGYRVELARTNYPHGIVKYHMAKDVPAASDDTGAASMDDAGLGRVRTPGRP